MSVYTKQAHDSTKGRGRNEASSEQRNFDNQAASIARQFGKGGYDGSTSADRATQRQQHDISDSARRESSADNRFALAGQEDARRSQVSDTVSGALDAQTSAEVKARQEQMNQDAGNNLGIRQNQFETGDKMRQLDFKEMATRTQRADAIAELYREGRAEQELFDAAIDGKLQMQDIEIYYKQVNNDLNNMFKLWEAGRKAEFEKAMSDMQTKAMNWSTMMGGGIQLLATLFTK